MIGIGSLITGNPAIAGGIGVAVVLGVIGFGAYQYKQGYDNGKNSVQVEWDRARETARVEAEKQRLADRKASEELAATFEAKARELEKIDAEKTEQLRTALQRRFICPKSGQIGDFVLPADVARGMFITRTKADGIVPLPTRASASQPRAAVR